MLKCSSERWVWAPQSLSAGTSTTPRLSVSFLVSVMGLSFSCEGGGIILSFRGGPWSQLAENGRNLLKNVICAHSSRGDGRSQIRRKSQIFPTHTNMTAANARSELLSSLGDRPALRTGEPRQVRR